MKFNKNKYKTPYPKHINNYHLSSTIKYSNNNLPSLPSSSSSSINTQLNLFNSIHFIGDEMNLRKYLKISHEQGNISDIHCIQSNIKNEFDMNKIYLKYLSQMKLKHENFSKRGKVKNVGIPWLDKFSFNTSTTRKNIYDKEQDEDENEGLYDIFLKNYCEKTDELEVDENEKEIREIFPIIKKEFYELCNDLFIYGYGSKLFIMNEFFLSFVEYLLYEEFSKNMKFVIIAGYDKTINVEKILDKIIEISFDNDNDNDNMKNKYEKLKKRNRIDQKIKDVRKKYSKDDIYLYILFHNIDRFSEKNDLKFFRRLKNEPYIQNDYGKYIDLNIRWIISCDDLTFELNKFFGIKLFFDTYRLHVVEYKSIFLKITRDDKRTKQFLLKFQNLDKHVKTIIAVVLTMAYHNRKKEVCVKDVMDLLRDKISFDISHEIEEIKDYVTLVGVNFLIKRKKMTINLLRNIITSTIVSNIYNQGILDEEDKIILDEDDE